MYRKRIRRYDVTSSVSPIDTKVTISIQVTKSAVPYPQYVDQFAMALYLSLV